MLMVKDICDFVLLIRCGAYRGFCVWIVYHATMQLLHTWRCQQTMPSSWLVSMRSNQSRSCYHFSDLKKTKGSKYLPYKKWYCFVPIMGHVKNKDDIGVLYEWQRGTQVWFYILWSYAWSIKQGSYLFNQLQDISSPTFFMQHVVMLFCEPGINIRGCRNNVKCGKKKNNNNKQTKTDQPYSTS